MVKGAAIAASYPRNYSADAFGQLPHLHLHLPEPAATVAPPDLGRFSPRRNRCELGFKADGVDGSRSRHRSAKMRLLSGDHEQIGATDMEITIVGLDLAKSISQIHAVDAAGRSSSEMRCAALR